MRVECIYVVVLGAGERINILGGHCMVPTMFLATASHGLINLFMVSISYQSKCSLIYCYTNHILSVFWTVLLFSDTLMYANVVYLHTTST